MLYKEDCHCNSFAMHAGTRLPSVTASAHQEGSMG